MRKRQVLWEPTSVPTFWINHASRLLMRRFDEQLRPLGLSMAYLHVALTLQEHGPLQQKDLLPFIHIEQPTMVALLKRMERDSLVSRKPNPKDSRAQFVVLTSRARSALVKAKAMMTQVVEDALAGVAEPERQRLTGTLQLIIRNLADAPSNLTDVP